MQNIKYEILQEVNKINFNPSTFDELVALLQITNDELELFTKALEALLDESSIFLNRKKDKYLSSRLANKYKGIIMIKNKDYGFVSNSIYPDFYVNSQDFNGAMNKDEVLYEITGDRAIILKIIKRYYLYLVGEVFYAQGRCHLDCKEKYLDKSVIIKNPKNIKAKDILRTRITNYNATDGYQEAIEVEVVDILGDNNTIGIDILQVLAQYGIEKEFIQKVNDEVQEITNDVYLQKDRRVDYTNKDIFTIDGEDAKDLDDAVGIEKLDNGNYRLGVYIADVSYYVTKNSALDEEALTRGTSIYLTDRVIPMLPVRLSNDLCSLNPNEEKLVIACIMEVDGTGEVVDRIINEGIIKTKKRLTYAKCNDVLENGLDSNQDYQVAQEALKMMQELSIILSEKRYRRGSIDFDIDESKIIVNEKGEAIDIIKRVRGISERIIEEFMILANETVAEFITDLDLPFIYRVHDKPDNVKFQTLKSVVHQLGYKVLGLYPKEIQKLMESLNEKDNYLKNTILKLMAKAVYSSENIGHFGLASRCYTHFTSPIRRYPDLLVHRLLRKYVINKDYADLQSHNDYLLLNNEITNIAQICSEAERVANELEFAVCDMKKAEYMEKHVGKTYQAIVSTILKFGIFVTLDNTVDGLVSVKALNARDFVYDDYQKCYLNRIDFKGTNNKKIRLGDVIKVKLVKANKKTGEIDFDLVYNISNGARSYGKSKSYFKK